MTISGARDVWSAGADGGDDEGRPAAVRFDGQSTTPVATPVA